MTIPKIIHQTYSKKNNLPPLFIDNIARLLELNSGWDYHLYDEEERREFISSHYDRDILGSYEKINPSYGPAKADFFRYLLLYQTGGVYLDVDCTLIKKLDDVLRTDDSYILSHWRNEKGRPHEGWGLYPTLGGRGEYQQWHIVAAPLHPFLEAVIQRVKKNIDNYDTLRDGVGKTGVIKVTGPIAYTQAIQSVQKDHNAFRYADAEDLGFVFSIIGHDDEKLFYESYFKNHYSLCTEPLLLPHFIKTIQDPISLSNRTETK